MSLGSSEWESTLTSQGVSGGVDSARPCQGMWIKEPAKRSFGGFPAYLRNIFFRRDLCRFASSGVEQMWLAASRCRYKHPSVGTRNLLLGPVRLPEHLSEREL